MTADGTPVRDISRTVEHTHGRSPERLSGDLNGAQRAAAQATSGPLVILAGAGTGKTRAISRRAAYAVESGVVPASRILLVTFTDTAADEMVERMAARATRAWRARSTRTRSAGAKDAWQGSPCGRTGCAACPQGERDGA